MKKVVVVGNGMVGYKFCEKLRSKASSDKIELVVFGEEPIPAYDRVHLSEYFSERSSEKLSMAPKNWYMENDVTLHTGELVTSIDRENKKVITHHGHEELYDKLVLATGSSALVPPITGVDKAGVFVYRTIEDLDNIISYGKNVKSAAVLGGGLLGLEAGKALMDMGLETHIIEFAPRLMPRQLDDHGSATLRQTLESLGLQIHLNKNTKEIRGNGKLERLALNDGGNLEVDMLVISSGIVPREEMATTCGLNTGLRGGMFVDNQLLTNAPDIYAIGVVAL